MIFERSLAEIFQKLTKLPVLSFSAWQLWLKSHC